jgi:hypothetical protein
MAGTRAALETRIADDLVDAPVTATQITDAVTDAIKHYESERFVFNEASNVSVSFSSSVDYMAMTSLPVYFVKIDRLRMNYSGGTNLTDLTPRDYAWIMAAQDAKSVSRPYEYCVYADRLQFDSAPSVNYTGILDGVKRLAPGATNSYSTSSSLAWFTDGALLIRYRAERDLLANIVRDDAEAQKKDLLEKLEYKALKAKLNTRNSGRIRPTQF